MYKDVHCITACKPQHSMLYFKLKPQGDVIEEFDMLSDYRPIISTIITFRRFCLRMRKLLTGLNCWFFSIIRLLLLIIKIQLERNIAVLKILT